MFMEKNHQESILLERRSTTKKKNTKKQNKTKRNHETDFYSVEIKTAHFDTVKCERFIKLS